jgi:hypothetical protein
VSSKSNYQSKPRVYSLTGETISLFDDFLVIIRENLAYEWENVSHVSWVSLTRWRRASLHDKMESCLASTRERRDTLMLNWVPGHLPATSFQIQLCQNSVQFRGPSWHFISSLFFFGEELLDPLPTPKLEHHPLSSVRDCLFSISEF